MNRSTRLAKKILPSLFLPYVRAFVNLLFRRDCVFIRSLRISKNFTAVTVLGNGPSLGEDSSKIRALISESDFVCVNNFACTDLFAECQPCLYIVLDDYFFAKDAHPDWICQREKTFKAIDLKTKWEMTLVLPASADIAVIRPLIKNTLVRIKKINTVSLSYKTEFLDFLHYRTGIFGPFQGNVLIYAIFLPMQLGYKEINIFGADMTFHKNVHVDQRTNNLFIKFTHHGEPDRVEKFLKNPQKISPFTMPEFFKLTADTFNAHHRLAMFALQERVLIRNCSSQSYIDSYDRG